MKAFIGEIKNRTQAGFTLVELMVVVAIIGILSAVAVPNFRTYQAKSKTSEAKLQLASLYSAQISWLGDYDTYATCLAEMGFNPAGEQANRYYAVGFAAFFAGSPDNCNAASGNVFAAGKGSNGAAVSTVTGTSASKTAFQARAEGNISTTAGTPNDIWSIDQNKLMVAQQRGY